MTVLIDTNILLDVIQRRVPHHVAAEKVWMLAEQGKLTAVVSAISFNNTFYILRKSLTVSQSIDVLRSIRQIYGVVPLDASAIDAAIRMTQSDFEDAIQVAAARSLQADYIVTRDKAGFRAAGVAAVTAEDLLAIIQP